MKCYTIAATGKIVPSIPVVDGEILIGESGRGRTLTKVAVPPTAEISDAVGAIEEVSVSGAWTCPADLGGGYWTGSNWFRSGDPRIAVAVSQGATVGNTRRLPAKGSLISLPQGNPTAIAVLVLDHSGFRGSWKLTGGQKIAEGFCAQGDAGRMGGGPEVLVVLGEGEEITICRTGRLYGHPSVLRFENRGGNLASKEETGFIPGGEE